jgi:hypothetical protein
MQLIIKAPFSTVRLVSVHVSGRIVGRLWEVNQQCALTLYKLVNFQKRKWVSRLKQDGGSLAVPKRTF